MLMTDTNYLINVVEVKRWVNNLLKIEGFCKKHGVYR